MARLFRLGRLALVMCVAIALCTVAMAQPGPGGPRGGGPGGFGPMGMAGMGMMMQSPYMLVNVEAVQKESCGRCVPCRIGTKVILDRLAAISAGQGSKDLFVDAADFEADPVISRQVIQFPAFESTVKVYFPLIIYVVKGNDIRVAAGVEGG